MAGTGSPSHTSGARPARTVPTPGPRPCSRLSERGGGLTAPTFLPRATNCPTASPDLLSIGRRHPGDSSGTWPSPDRRGSGGQGLGPVQSVQSCPSPTAVSAAPEPWALGWAVSRALETLPLARCAGGQAPALQPPSPPYETPPRGVGIEREDTRRGPGWRLYRGRVWAGSGYL